MSDFLDPDHFEVVQVISERSLIDAESYQRRYEGGQPLARGYYAVVWPGGQPARYDDSARFIGPFPSAQEARHAPVRAQAHQ